MEVTVQIPDDIAASLAATGSDLSRRALEGFALEELRAGRITEPHLGKMLGLARIQIDGFSSSMASIRTTPSTTSSRNGRRSMSWGCSLCGW
ncbi:MAG TPA: hypothetical protein VHW09_04515 [Bryobacteraceae bacterium]|nr:hypothetical protein [Bryobacteraceae bacterium]